MLDELYSQPGVTEERLVDVVVIPGVGTPSPSDWCHSEGPSDGSERNWLKRLQQDLGHKAQIFVYHYDVLGGQGQGSVVKRLLEEGAKMLADLREFCARKKSLRRYLFFVCHSLGGIILKETLNTMRKDVVHYDHIIEVLSGILFLGTPHLQSHVRHKDVVQLIITAAIKRPPRDFFNAADNAALCNLGDNFKAFASPLPIISCYEAKKSYVRRTLDLKSLLRSRRLKIITADLCCIGGEKEILQASLSAHEDMCRIQVDSQLYNLVKDNISSAVAKVATLRQEQSGMTGGFPQASERSQSLSPVNRNVLGVDEDSGLAIRGTTDSSYVNVPSIVNFEDRKNPTLPCFAVQTYKRNSQFFERTGNIFAQMDNALLPQPPVGSASAHIQTFALSGLGGIGKTQLALEYVYSRKAEFDAIFWVSADDPKILGENFGRIAVRLGLMDAAGDMAEACACAQGWLSNPVRTHDENAAGPDASKEASWLLVFDNADDLTVLDDYWPHVGVGSVLVTSRDPMARFYENSSHQGLAIESLSLDEAVRFIEARAPFFAKAVTATDRAYIREIAKKAGQIPLLLNQVPGNMKENRLNWKETAEMLEAQGIEDGGQNNQDRRSYEAAFAVFSNFGIDKLQPKTLGLFQVMAMLDPDLIPEEIFKHAFAKANSGGNCPQSAGEYYSARSELTKRALIEHHDEASAFRLHRTVLEAVSNKMQPVQRMRVLELTISAVSGVWPFGTLEDRFKKDRYPTCGKFFPSVVRLKSALTALLGQGQSLEQPDVSAKLLNDAGWYWFERGNMHEAKEFFLATERLYETVPPEERSPESVFHLRRANLNHATASMETNDAQDSLHRYKKYVDELDTDVTKEAMLSSPDQAGFQYELACIYNELGVAYAMNEDFRLATYYFEKSIESFHGLSEYRDTMLDWPMPNLGFMLWLQGEYAEAKNVLLEILDVRTIAYGPDETESFKGGKILYALGNVCASQGFFDESFQWHQKCLRQYRATLGDGHHRVADISHRLADHYIRLGRKEDFAEAGKLLDQALKIFGSRPFYRNELARTTYKRAQMLKAMGRSDDAEDEFREAYELRRRVRPDDGRPAEMLKEADYDSLVTFWSR